jgi:hypothetical protein
MLAKEFATFLCLHCRIHHENGVPAGIPTSMPNFART